jgi:hypothetical protein
MRRSVLQYLLLCGLAGMLVCCSSGSRGEQQPGGSEAGQAQRKSQQPVTVRGSLTVGRTPLSSARLTFAPVGASSKPTAATTDGAGRYTAILARAGDYVISIAALPFLSGGTRLATLSAPDSELDIPFPDTRCAVTVGDGAGGAIKEPVQIEVVRDSGYKQSVLVAGVVRPKDGRSFTLVGLDEGEYVISADTAKGWSTSEVHRVRLIAGESATVRLVLRPQSFRLRVLDSEGSRLAGVTAEDRSRALDAVGVGEFNLARTSAGDLITIAREGFVPVCRRVGTLRGDLEVRLEKANGTLTLESPPRRSAVGLGYLEMLPGSDCGVPLRSFASTVEDRPKDRLTRVTLRGVPSGSFFYRGGDEMAAIPLRVPGPATRIQAVDTHRECAPRLNPRPSTR